MTPPRAGAPDSPYSDPGRIAARNPMVARLADCTTLLAVFAAFAISGLALSAMGVMYAAPGGNFLHKIHPASWIFAIALFMNVLRQADRMAYLALLPRRLPGAAFFAVMWTLTVAYAIVVQHAPVMPLIDTFFPALAMLVLYDDLDPGTRRLVRLLLHGLMFTNACLGIFEFLTGFRLTPYAGDVKVIGEDYRSTALFGHPLLNAGTTGLYILALFFGGDAALGPLRRFALMLPQMLAMIPFGGRTSIIMSLGLMALGALPAGAAMLNGRRFDMRLGVAVALGVPAFISAGAAAVSYGFLDRLIDRFVDDSGSAKTRVVMFQLLDEFPLEELLFGPDQERLLSLQHTLGIEYGIENSWLGLLFQYGGLMTFFFLIGFCALLWEFWRRAGSHAFPIFFLFFVQVSSAASLSVKSLALTQFAILLLGVFGRAVAEPASPDARDAPFRSGVPARSGARWPMRA